MEPKKPALSSKSGSEKASGPWRPTKRQVLWAICMVVALLTTALLIIHLRPEIWKVLLEERNLTLIAIGVSVTAIIVLLAIGGASLGGTGFGDKTLWDWLQLLSALAIPVVLAAAGLWFTAQQDQRQQDIENERAQQAEKIENQRAAAERELAKQRAQDETLQAYLDQMSHLLLEKDLRGSKEDSVVRTLARARTFAVMQRLDAERNKTVARFLSESKLIETDGTTIGLLKGASLEHADLVGVDLHNAHLYRAGLNHADLHNADLSRANLQGASLNQTNLREAYLDGADLRGSLVQDANLYNAFLRNANLSYSILSYSNLSRSNPRDANLQDAFLDGANLHKANLSESDLSDAYLTNANLSGTDLGHADLSDADLSNANLRGAAMYDADLSSADLGHADLFNAHLSDTNLSNTSLHKANLSGAGGVTNEELAQQAETLEGATMPNGQKYEDWRKDREGRKEDAENE